MNLYGSEVPFDDQKVTGITGIKSMPPPAPRPPQQMFQRAGAGLDWCGGGCLGCGERCGNLDFGRLCTQDSLCAETLQTASHPFICLKMHTSQPVMCACVYLPGVSAPPSLPASPLWAGDLSSESPLYWQC